MLFRSSLLKVNGFSNPVEFENFVNETKEFQKKKINWLISFSHQVLDHTHELVYFF